mgnify:CR=1 FL=1
MRIKAIPKKRPGLSSSEFDTVVKTLVNKSNVHMEVALQNLRACNSVIFNTLDCLCAHKENMMNAKTPFLEYEQAIPPDKRKIVHATKSKFEYSLSPSIPSRSPFGKLALGVLEYSATYP